MLARAAEKLRSAPGFSKQFRFRSEYRTLVPHNREMRTERPYCISFSENVTRVLCEFVNFLTFCW